MRLSRRKKRKPFLFIILLLLAFAITFFVYNVYAGGKLKFAENLNFSEEAEIILKDKIANFDKHKNDSSVKTLSDNFYLKKYDFTHKNIIMQENAYELYLSYDIGYFGIKRLSDNKFNIYQKGFSEICINNKIINNEFKKHLNNVKFELKDASIEQGDFTYLVAKNIKIPSYLSIVMNNEKIKYFKVNDGSDDYLAIIPSSFDAKTGLKKISLSYGMPNYGYSEKKFDLEIKARKFSKQYLIIDEDEAKKKRTMDARKEFFYTISAAIAEKQYEYTKGVKEFFEGFKNPSEAGILTTEYGVIRYVNNNKSSYSHAGLDIALAKGTDVFSTADGKVVFADTLTLTGNTVIVSHGFSIYSVYCHMDSLNCKKGDEVNIDTKIGEVGTTGFSTGDHLHFEILYNNMNLDPGEFLYNSQVRYDNFEELFNQQN